MMYSGWSCLMMMARCYDFLFSLLFQNACTSHLFCSSVMTDGTVCAVCYLCRVIETWPGNDTPILQISKSSPSLTIPVILFYYDNLPFQRLYACKYRLRVQHQPSRPSQ